VNTAQAVLSSQLSHLVENRELSTNGIILLKKASAVLQKK
jgi:hypothetical protein